MRGMVPHGGAGCLLQAMEQFLYLKNAIVLFAEEHKDTLYVIHTHTQHAQPGLLGHYFLGAADMLERDFKRLCRAYDAVNQSPMGAAAVTTTGFPVSRERVAELAGFSGMIENAYDAIGNSDYLTQTASALGLCALDMGRIVTDLLLWATQEMNMIHVADGYISISSIMPQKRNPIALEHLRSSLSVLKGMADTVLTGFLKSRTGIFLIMKTSRIVYLAAWSCSKKCAVVPRSYQYAGGKQRIA